MLEKLPENQPHGLYLNADLLYVLFVGGFYNNTEIIMRVN